MVNRQSLIRAVVFCDDRYHPAATVRAGLAPLEGEGLKFDWVESAAEWDPDSLPSYPAALLSKSNAISHADTKAWLSNGTETVFRDYVRSGGGLVVVHSGTASYAEVPAMRGVIGGTFRNHPPECEVVVEPKSGHALTAGIDKTFTIWDEHYFIELDDARADVFLHSRSAHGVQPAGWTRKVGAGRVCVLTPGHTAAVWLHPEFQKLLRNAFGWVTA